MFPAVTPLAAVRHNHSYTHTRTCPEAAFTLCRVFPPHWNAAPGAGPQPGCPLSVPLGLKAFFGQYSKRFSGVCDLLNSKPIPFPATATNGAADGPWKEEEPDTMSTPVFTNTGIVFELKRSLAKHLSLSLQEGEKSQAARLWIND